MTKGLWGLALFAGLAMASCGDDTSGDDLPPGAFTSGPPGSGDGGDVVDDGMADTSTGTPPAEGSSSSEGGDDPMSDESTGPPQEVSFAAELEPLIGDTCFGAGCHDDDAPGAAGGLNLSPDGVDDPYTNLTTRMHLLSGMPYVTVGEPQASYLYRKLEGTHLEGDLEGQGSGGQMPLTQDELSPQDMRLFRDWILTGAMP
jgi:hypothetical protein